MANYPQEYGPKNKSLPEFASPLNIDAGKGDTGVPQNDMYNVAGPKIGNGGEFPDPLGFLKGID